MEVGSEVWVPTKRDEKRLVASQSKSLRQLLGITKLDRERNQTVGYKLGVQNIVREPEQYQQK